MDAATNTGVSFHTKRHGLTRMPAFENLAAVTHFQRRKPHAPSRLVFPHPSPATRRCSYDESHKDGRVFSPNLPIVQSRPVKVSTNVKPANRNKSLANDAVCTPATTSSTRSRRQTADHSSSPETNISAPRSTPATSIHSESTSASELSYLRPLPLFSSPRTDSRRSAVRKTSDITDRHSSQTTLNHHAPRTPNTALASDGNDGFQQRRTHAIVQGQLVPVLLPPVSRGSNDKALPLSRTTPTGATMTVGARPLLHTAQGFPLDMRQSQVEAGRICNVPLDLP